MSLDRKTPLKRTGGLKRTGRLKPRSDRQTDRDAEINEAILAAKDRDRWQCQAHGLGISPGCSGSNIGVDGQHLVKRSLAPDHAADPRIIVTLCRLCHGRADIEPLLGQSWGVVVPAWVVDQHGPEFVRAVTVDLRYQLRLGRPMLAPWLAVTEIILTGDRDPRYHNVEVLPWPGSS